MTSSNLGSIVVGWWIGVGILFVLSATANIGFPIASIIAGVLLIGIYLWVKSSRTE
jgi:hypothetical protein